MNNLEIKQFAHLNEICNFHQLICNNNLYLINIVFFVLFKCEPVSIYFMLQYQDGESRRQNPEGEGRRRHSSVDDIKSKMLQLDRATLERKDSNLSESSDTSLELQSIMRQETLSTGTDSTDKTDSTVIRMDEDVFSSPEW